MEKDAPVSKIDEYVRKFGSASRFVQKLIDSFDCPFAIVNANTHEIEVTNSKDFFPGMKCQDLFKRTDEDCSSDDCPVASVLSSKRAVVAKGYCSKEMALEMHAHPIFDAAGEVTSVIIYGLDISRTEALKESEERFHSLFDGAEDAIFIADPETGKMIDCNDSAVELMGYVKREILEMVSVDLHPEDIKEEVVEAFAKHASGEKFVFETEILKKDGKTRVPVSVNSSLINILGKTYLQGVFRDVSDRRKIEGEVEDLARLSSENYNPIMRIGKDKVLLYANDAAKDIFGEDNLGIGSVISERWHGMIDAVFASGEVDKDVEVELLGGVFSWTIVPVKGMDYINAYGIDITEKKKAEEISKESERVLRHISEGTSRVTGGLFLNNLLKCLTEALGFKYGVIGKLVENGEKVEAVVFWKDGKRGENFVYDLRGTPCEEVTKKDVCFYPKDVTEYFPRDRILVGLNAQSYFGVPLKNSMGEVIGILNVFHDEPIEKGGLHKDVLKIFANKIVAEFERESIESSLSESEKNFESLAWGALEGIMVFNESGEIVYANSSAGEITGYMGDEILGKTIKDLAHPEELDVLLNNFKQRLEGTNSLSRYDTRMIKKNGEALYVELAPAKIVWKDEPGVLCLFHDIGERRKVREKLEKSERKFRKFFESSPRGMLMYRVMPGNKLVLIDSNSAVDNILRIDSRSFVGKSIEDIFPDLAKTEIPAVFSKIAVDGNTCYKSEIAYDDGTVSGFYEFVAFQTSPSVVVTSFTDISDRKRTEQKLREKDEQYVREIEDRFYNILQNSQDLVYRYNFKSDIFDYVSESVFTILGYSLGEFMKMNMTDYNKRIHPEDIAAVNNLGNSSEEEFISTVDYRFKKKDGDYIWLRDQRVFFRGKDGELIYSIEDIKDITFEKMAEDEKSRLEERLVHLRNKASETKERVTLTDREKMVLWGFCRYPLLNDEELAQKLDLKRSTLTAIKNRLKGKGWFSLNYIPNFHKLGCQFFSIFDATFKHGKSEGVDIVKNEPGVVLSNSQDDKLLAAFVSDKYVDFKRFLEDFAGVDLSRHGLNEDSFFYDLDNAQLCDVSGLINSLFGLKRREKAVVYKFENGGGELNTNEKRVLDAMVKNPEMSSSDIAKKIWTSKPTVIKVKKKLLDEGFVYPYVTPDFVKMGLSYIGKLSFSFDSDLPDLPTKGFNDSGVLLSVKGKRKMMKIMLFASEEEFAEEVDLIREFYHKNGIGLKLTSEIFPIQKRRSGNSKMETFVNDRLFGDEI